jgi:hypothetical protein
MRFDFLQARLFMRRGSEANWLSTYKISAVQPEPVTRIETAGFGPTQNITAQFRRQGDGNWTESNNVWGTDGFKFAEQSQTFAEVVIFDDRRDTALKFELAGKLVLIRQGANGEWRSLYRIVSFAE